jgi:site-specific DNA recombinase
VTATVPPVKRCAIYTRKSSEEGLDQAYNSLHAQRDAGEAFVKSQSHEGWRLIATAYDDGGFSGGSMERPGLRALLANIAAGQIDVVIVYKIDRLTRSLADFARMVELFDQHAVSFVSVTQSFNTTSSMGRLTLNVLLSFAQFEREVTGERIRDKIAASKAKGMWMGGTLPLGYDLPADAARTLVANDAEAATVRHIISAYLALGSVHALERQLIADSICSKRRVTRTGKLLGGCAISRGALFHMLRNRTYLGQIVHRDAAYPAAHLPIIEQAQFDAVQAMLDANRVRRPSARADVAPAVWTGRLFDADGNPMSPTFSRGVSGRLYRYYVSAPLQQGARLDRSTPRRVSAKSLDAQIAVILGALLPDVNEAQIQIGRIEVHRDGLHLAIPLRLGRKLQLADGAAYIDADAIADGHVRLVWPCMFGGAARTIERSPGTTALRHDPALIKALRHAHRLMHKDAAGNPMIDVAPVSPYLRRQIRLAFLAPDIQRDILAGRQPLGLTLEQMMQEALPASWAAQRRQFGWPEQG